MSLILSPTISSLLFFLLVSLAEGGIFDWVFGTTKENDEPDHSMGSSLGKMVSVPFELRTADEKFLVEAAKFGLQSSDLDICHNRVIMKLKKSCSSLTEEDIGKLSVHLLNCQSSVEGRKTFQCNDDMSIAQCTKEMDPNTWNSYHIVSNRARAVCYASRQQQFSVKTEMTVNKLMWTSEQQISALKNLEEGQLRVGEMTSKTLQTMATGQKELSERQELLKSSQKHIQSFVHGNLRELTREKALIAAGHKELANMTQAIQEKLEEASKEMVHNEEKRKINHLELIQDLAAVQEKAKEMWNRIDASTERLLQQQNEAVGHYQMTLENLERINSSISYLMNLVNQVKIEVDGKLGWLSKFLFEAGDQLSVIYCCTVHGAYFVVSAVAASFIGAPFLPRAALLISVPLNAVCQIRQQSSLDFPSLTLLLAVTLVIHWLWDRLKLVLTLQAPFYRICYRAHSSISNTFREITWKITGENEKKRKFFEQCTQRKNSYGPLASSIIHEKEEYKTNDLTEYSVCKPDTSTPNGSPAGDHLKQLNNNLAEQLELISGDSLTSIASSRTRRASMNSNSSLLSRKVCCGVNKAGTPCKGLASASKDFCYRHLDQE